MELHLKKNSAAELMFPMVDKATPETLKTGETVTDTAYYKDGAGVWTALAITDTVTEIGTTGMYTIELTAAEMNHDLIMVKVTAANSADSVIIIRTFARNIEDLAFPTVSGRSLDVSATGEAGLDFDNFKVASVAKTLTNITVPVVTNLTGHTAQTADHTAGIAAIPTVMRGTDNAALAVDYDAGRALLLDKLNVTGNVASSAEVTAIQNNTRVRVMVPGTMERPDTGSTAFKLHLYLYDTAGNMAAPDSPPTITAVNQSGVSRAVNLGAVTLVSTGYYTVIYTIDTAHLIEQLIFEWTIVEGGATRQHGAAAQVVDTTAVDFTAADRTKLDNLDVRLTDARATKLDNLDGAITSRQPSGNVTVGGYAAGQAPADGVLVTPANKLATDATGKVTVGVNSDKTGYSISGAKQTLDALKDFDPATQTVDVGKMAGSATAATNIKDSALRIVTGAAVAGTLSVTTMTTDLTEATNDHYKGRVIVWDDGPLKDQATDVTAYDGTTKQLTFTAVTDIPVAGNKFRII